jgi:valyl-tRNA synthetase
MRQMLPQDDMLSKAVQEAFIQLHAKGTSTSTPTPRPFASALLSHSLLTNPSHVAWLRAGLIYRDNRLVNWCCALKTAISDIEVRASACVLHVNCAAR